MVSKMGLLNVRNDDIGSGALTVVHGVEELEEVESCGTCGAQ